jgi:opacity protein-like surface antigen
VQIRKALFALLFALLNLSKCRINENTGLQLASSSNFGETKNQQTMKNKIKSLAAVVTILFTAAATSAQNRDTVVVKHDTVYKKEKSERPPLRRVELGVRYLPTFSLLRFNTYSGETVQGQVSMSHGVGVNFGLNFTKNIGIEAEVNYVEINQKYKDANLNRQVGVTYLNIPVMLSINTDKTAPVNLNFVVGPQWGLNMGARVSGGPVSNNSETYHATIGVKSGDAGLAYGAGLEFMLNDNHTLRLDIGARGYYGFVDIKSNQSNTNPDTYNVIVKGSRKSYNGYIGLSFLF